MKERDSPGRGATDWASWLPVINVGMKKVVRIGRRWGWALNLALLTVILLRGVPLKDSLFLQGVAAIAAQVGSARDYVQADIAELKDEIEELKDEVAELRRQGGRD